MIVIVDYGAGNLGSIVNMFKRLGVSVRVANSPNGLDGATAILLPGIGHFDSCSKNLKNRGFGSAMEEYVLGRRLPLLGICVGAQLLTKGSEEGDEPGLGWIDAVTRRFPMTTDQSYKVPHMGWNVAEPVVHHQLLVDLESKPRFYFAHSYYIQPSNPDSVLCKTHHGVDFASGIYRDNIAGVQFHPEKSHRFGLQLLKNFSQFSIFK
jgi:glutamine amidotransferase